jgi:ferrochelatase
VSVTQAPRRPFDAVLVISFGGPEGLGDIRPFLANVLRGRRVSPERIEEVAKHYEAFGGVSPLTAITGRQADGLRRRLVQRGFELPVYLGMRNWHPFLRDTLQTMSQDGVRRAIGFICAAHRSYSSCTQYRENVAEARATIVKAGHHDVTVTFVSDWHTHSGFVDANARHVEIARARLPEGLRGEARLVFTAHSIPRSMAGAARYQQQLKESAERVAAQVGMADWTIVYQSRSGRPEDPWLEPDVRDYLQAEHRHRLKPVVLCPLGFLCDHIEVLYDLDHEAAQLCSAIGLPMVRAEAVNDDERFLDAMTDAVMETWRRHETGAPLPVVPARVPEDGAGVASRGATVRRGG